jgi:hypothetical protein
LLLLVVVVVNELCPCVHHERHMGGSLCCPTLF